MSPLQIILGVALLLMAIFLVVVVMLQDKAKQRHRSELPF